MGIEYVTMIGVLVLLMTATFSYGDFSDGGDGDGDDTGGSQIGGEGSGGGIGGDSGEGETSGDTDSYNPSGSNQYYSGSDPTREIYQIMPDGTKRILKTTKDESGNVLVLEKVRGAVEIVKMYSDQKTTFDIDRYSAGGLRVIIKATKEQNNLLTNIEEELVKRFEIADAMKERDRISYIPFRINTNDKNLEADFFITVLNDWWQQENIDQDTIVASKFTDDMEFVGHLPTELISENSEARTYKVKMDCCSYIVISAQNIVKGPSLCDNDGVCDITESEATCPTDCYVLDQTKEDCENGAKTCIGYDVYECVSKSWIENSKCENNMICVSGECIESPDSTNMIYGVIIAIIMIMGLGLSVIFLRK